MRRLLAPLLGATLLLSSVGVVSADSTYTFDPVACAFFEGGSITVDPGTTVVLRSGWTATTHGQILSFVQASTWLVTVNGTSIDVTPYLQISQIDRKFWAVFWEYPVGTLGLAATLNISLDVVMNHPNFDGTTLYPRGSVLGGPVHCLVTGAVSP